MIASVDANSDEEIDFDEFYTMMRHKTPNTQQAVENELKEIFDIFDKDGDGQITTDELFSVLQKIHPGITKHEINLMMDSVDEDNDHEISFDEFTKMMKQAPNPFTE
jgi:Ca2+-binding EF-hand superfamily protein